VIRRPALSGALSRARRSPLVFDIGLAVVMAVVTLLGSLGEGRPTPQFDKPAAGQHIPHVGAAAAVLVLVSALALIWRRRAPVTVLAVSLTAVVAYTCLGYVNGAAMLNPIVALYAVAVACPIRWAIALSLLTMTSLMAASAAFDPLGATNGGFVVIPGLVAAALLLGLWVASRHAERRESEERARRAVDAERLRIARELHDVVAHTMATINVQAGVARHVIESQPEQAAQALEAIRRASKEGLRELRGLLNVLRQADEHEETAPAPRLAQLGGLIEGTERAGLPTTLTVHGDPRPVSPAVETAAYRIVQESLTNALRHAGASAATVTLSYAHPDLRLEITDDGRGLSGYRTSHGAGHGIAGMQERAAAARGTLEAGPRPEGGFRVSARLPLSEP
jgi:signal transduction histidine kinase